MNPRQLRESESRLQANLNNIINGTCEWIFHDTAYVQKFLKLWISQDVYDRLDPAFEAIGFVRYLGRNRFASFKFCKVQLHRVCSRYVYEEFLPELLMATFIG